MSALKLNQPTEQSKPLHGTILHGIREESKWSNRANERRNSRHRCRTAIVDTLKAKETVQCEENDGSCSARQRYTVECNGSYVVRQQHMFPLPKLKCQLESCAMPKRDEISLLDSTENFSGAQFSLWSCHIRNAQVDWWTAIVLRNKKISGINSRPLRLPNAYQCNSILSWSAHSSPYTFRCMRFLCWFHLQHKQKRFSIARSKHEHFLVRFLSWYFLYCLHNPPLLQLARTNIKRMNTEQIRQNSPRDQQIEWRRSMHNGFQRIKKRCKRKQTYCRHVRNAPLFVLRSCYCVCVCVVCSNCRNEQMFKNLATFIFDIYDCVHMWLRLCVYVCMNAQVYNAMHSIQNKTYEHANSTHSQWSNENSLLQLILNVWTNPLLLTFMTHMQNEAVLNKIERFWFFFPPFTWMVNEESLHETFQSLVIKHNFLIATLNLYFF